MKQWFALPAGAGPVPPDDALPGTARRLGLADRSCCCPARPMFTVIIPAGSGRRHPVDLLLCGHHYRASLAALLGVGADAYDETGALVLGGGTGGQGLPADPPHPVLRSGRTDRPDRQPRPGRLAHQLKKEA